jgi:hypothetical protein
MTILRKRLEALAASCILWGLGAAPLMAQEPNSQVTHCCVDWKRLNLNQPQSDQIQQLEQQWSSQYVQLKVQIRNQQLKLRRELGDPRTDPLEIVSTQQSILRLQEQLRNEATTNYLHKRALLNEDQQHQMEAQLHQMVIERQQRAMGQKPQEDQNAGIMGLINKIRWAIDPH